MSGAGYCTRLSACRNFVVHKCSKCATTLNRIEIKMSLRNEPEDVKLTLTCYSNAQKLCDPFHSTWSEVENSWFRHCKGTRANRTKRFVPACGAVAPGGWTHGFNRRPPPLSVFGAPMLMPPPMRPSPCQQGPPPICVRPPCAPSCGGGRCGGGGPPPPLRPPFGVRPCGMGGPCGGGGPPSPPLRPPFGVRPCGMGGPCGGGGPPPLPLRPPFGQQRPCGLGGPCGGNLPPPQRPPYIGNRPQPPRRRPRPPGPRPPRPRPRPPRPIITTRQSRITQYTTNRPVFTPRRLTYASRTHPPTTRFNRIQSTSWWTTRSTFRPRTTLTTIRRTRRPRITMPTTTTRVRGRSSSQVRTTTPRAPPLVSRPGRTRKPPGGESGPMWPEGTRTTSRGPPTPLRKPRPPWMGITPIERRVTTLRVPDLRTSRGRPQVGPKEEQQLPWQWDTSTTTQRPQAPWERRLPTTPRRRPTKFPKRRPVPPRRQVPTKSPRPGVMLPDWESTTPRFSGLPGPWGPPNGPEGGQLPSWQMTPSTSFGPGLNPPDWQRPSEPGSTTPRVSGPRPPWGPPHGSGGGPVPPGLEVPQPGQRPSDWESPSELRMTTPIMSGPPIPWGPPHGSGGGYLPPGQISPPTSPAPGINPPDWGRPIEPRSTTAGMSGLSTPSGLPYGSEGGSLSPWQMIPSTSPRPGLNPPDWERPVEPRSTTPGMLGLPTPRGLPHGSEGGSLPPWQTKPSTSPQPGPNPHDWGRPIEPQSTMVGMSGLSTPSGLPYGSEGESLPPWQRIPSTSPRPGPNLPDREWSVEPRSTTPEMLGMPTPRGLPHGSEGGSLPPWQMTPSTSPQPRPNPHDWERSFEPGSTTPGVSGTPWGQPNGPDGGRVPPWQGVPSTSPQPGQKPPDWEHTFEPRSTTVRVPGLPTPLPPSHVPWEVHGASTPAQPGIRPLGWEIQMNTSKEHGLSTPQMPGEQTGFSGHGQISTTLTPHGHQMPPWAGPSTPGFPSLAGVPGRPSLGQGLPAGAGVGTPLPPLGGSYSGPGSSPDNTLGFQLSKLERPDSTDEIFSGVEYKKGMNSDVFIDQLAERCKTLAYKKPPDIHTAKMKNNNSNVDEALVLKQLQLRRQKQEMWCAFVEHVLQQRQKCQSDRSRCKKVTQSMPGGIEMDVWVYNDNRVQNNPQITDNSVNININSNNNGQPSNPVQGGKNAQHEELLRKLEEIQAQQKQIQQKILEQEKQTNLKVGATMGQKPDNLTLQRNILASRSRTQLISEAKSKLQILITIAKGLKKEMSVMTEKKAEYASKLKSTNQIEISLKSECESIIDYVSESDLEHHKMIVEFETLIEILNTTMVDLEIHHQDTNTGGQQIGQQTFSTFVYYLQEASNTIKLFNQNHQLIHANAENRMKNSNAKNIVHNIYQFVYVKGKADCDECLRSSKSPV